MSLFVINRYQGESKEEIKDNTDHLSNLLERIAERKRQRSVINNESISENVDKSNAEKPKKKKKRNKSILEGREGKEINNLYIEDKNKSNKKINEHSSETKEAQVRNKKKKLDIEKEDDSPSEHFITQDQQLKKRNKNLENEEESNDNRNTRKNEIPSQSNFMVLGVKPHKKQHVVKRVLPDWLAHPEIISADLNSGPSIEDLNSILDHKLIEILRANGIVKLFPVQSSVIKWLHTCNKDRRIGWWLRDTCVSAPTGSGKQWDICNR